MSTSSVWRVKCIGETGAALKLVIDGQVKWCPKSVVVDSETEVSEVGDEGKLVVQEWFALKEGWV